MVGDGGGAWGASAAAAGPGSMTMRIIAEELRQRAQTAIGKEKDDLLFLAAEYDALAENEPGGDPEGDFVVMLPK